MKIEVEAETVARISEAINAIGSKSVCQRAVREAFNVAGDDIASQAKRLVKVRSGRLRDSIKRKTTIKRNGMVVLRVFPGKGGMHGGLIEHGFYQWKPFWSYNSRRYFTKKEKLLNRVAGIATNVAFSTIYHAPQPYMGPAFKARVPLVPQMVVDQMAFVVYRDWAKRDRQLSKVGLGA
jgi:hypothetical protein